MIQRYDVGNEEDAPIIGKIPNYPVITEFHRFGPRETLHRGSIAHVDLESVSTGTRTDIMDDPRVIKLHHIII